MGNGRDDICRPLPPFVLGVASTVTTGRSCSPGMSGACSYRWWSSKEHSWVSSCSRLLWVLLFSAMGIRQSMEPLAQLREGTRRVAAQDFTARVRISSGDEFEELAGSFNNMAEQVGTLFEELRDLNWSTITTLARTIDAKSPWTAGHSERVSQMSVAIARVMGLGEVEIERLYRGGLLHDIGKIGVPITIIDKKGRLTDEEMAVMRSHVTIGAKILEPLAASRT